MKSSTGLPAMTSIIMRRGFLSLETNSLMEWAPTMDLPLASSFKKRSTLATLSACQCVLAARCIEALTFG